MPEQVSTCGDQRGAGAGDLLDLLWPLHKPFLECFNTAGEIGINTFSPPPIRQLVHTVWAAEMRGGEAGDAGREGADGHIESGED